MTMNAAPEFIYAADGRISAVAIAGIHAGCYELFGNDRVRAVRDLKGKTISVYALGGADHVLLSSMLAYVGIDPRKDVIFIAATKSMDAMRLFVEGKSDAYLAFAPAPQELRARKIGRVIVNTTQDRPWSQYFCCVVIANRDFVAKHPVATKCALRAFLKGKTVPVDGFGGSQHVLLSSMAAYVGLDPRKDINWVIGFPPEGKRLFVEGKADAYLGFPPDPQELRAKGIGKVIVNTAIDKPWSQYYCCMLISHPEFVQQYPVATKRATRAMLKAADLCATEPERVGRMLVEKKVTDRHDYALETLREVRYDAWRLYDPEDAMRFHAIRLHDVGLIKTSPNRLIAKGTDWRFLNELRREMKG
jgi:ABC-type nitrate/sulfonate/bicarbonate transport system substrate-binding protein